MLISFAKLIFAFVFACYADCWYSHVRLANITNKMYVFLLKKSYYYSLIDNVGSEIFVRTIKLANLLP